MEAKYTFRKSVKLSTKITNNTALGARVQAFGSGLGQNE